MNRMSPSSRALIFLALALLLIVFVAGCDGDGAKCVWKETGHRVDDKLCSVGNPDYEWRKA